METQEWYRKYVFVLDTNRPWQALSFLQTGILGTSLIPRQLLRCVVVPVWSKSHGEVIHEPEDSYDAVICSKVDSLATLETLEAQLLQCREDMDLTIVMSLGEVKVSNRLHSGQRTLPESEQEKFICIFVEELQPVLQRLLAHFRGITLQVREDGTHGFLKVTAARCTATSLTQRVYRHKYICLSRKMAKADSRLEVDLWIRYRRRR